MGEEGAAKTETRAMVAWARDEILKLLHPFMPFITEELWAVTGEHGVAGKRSASSWRSTAMAATTLRPRLTAESRRRGRDRLGGRSRHRDSLGARGNEHSAGDVAAAGAGGRSAETKNARSAGTTSSSGWPGSPTFPLPMRAPEGAVQLCVRGEVAALPLKGVIDLAAERARLDKEMAKGDADIARVDAKLNNPNFVASAPEEVVEEEKEKREEALARKAKIAEALQRLKDSD